MIAPTLNENERAVIREDWIKTVQALAEQVTAWSNELGWKVEREEKSVEEPPLGTYRVPVLNIDTPDGRVILEPGGRNTPRYAGVVWLSAYPTYYRVHLLWDSRKAEWIVRTDSGLNWPYSWNPRTFRAIATGLLRDS